MKFDRTKNALRNIIFGLLQRIYQLIVPFAMRTAMIYWLGVEYLGLDGLFISVLSVLNLAELACLLACLEIVIFTLLIINPFL